MTPPISPAFRAIGTLLSLKSVNIWDRPPLPLLRFQLSDSLLTRTTRKQTNKAINQGIKGKTGHPFWDRYLSEFASASSSVFLRGFVGGTLIWSYVLFLPLKAVGLSTPKGYIICNRSLPNYR